MPLLKKGEAMSAEFAMPFVTPCPHCNSFRDSWFDRTVSIDNDTGKETGPCYRCDECGKDVNESPEEEEE